MEIWESLTPMWHASVKDITHAVLFMVSGDARHTTGQSLVIDGCRAAIGPSHGNKGCNSPIKENLRLCCSVKVPKPYAV